MKSFSKVMATAIGPVLALFATAVLAAGCAVEAPADAHKPLEDQRFGVQVHALVDCGAVNCDDDSICTTDACDVNIGCVNTANVAACSDGILCTTSDACAAGACVGAPVNCDDSNACTTDACDPGTGACTNTNITNGTSCGTGFACQTGACVATCSQASDCDDGNTCTTDTCEVAGCSHASNGTCSITLNTIANLACDAGYTGGTVYSQSRVWDFQTDASGWATTGSWGREVARGVQCWGYNGNNQVGDGTSTNRSAPVQVSGLASGAASLTTGSSHACAVLTSGAAVCWGYNGNGQLGDSTLTQRSSPVAVTGLASGVGALAGGGSHTCALTTAGAVQCWGYNGYGQLGDSTLTQRSSPVAVTGLASGVGALAGGSSHTCALTTAGAVQCWGYNGYGQLGDSTYTQRTSPVAVSGLGSGVTAIAAGSNHTCAITSGGALKCWGYNAYGQLGDGTTTTRTTPVAVSGLGSGVTSVELGDLYSCALLSSGAVQCWGYNGNGQLGDGTTTARTVPTAVSGLTSGVSAIAAGRSHTCATLTTGALKCWGYNGYGELGDGTTTQRTTPTAVPLLPGDTMGTSMGDYFSCAVVENRNLSDSPNANYTATADTTASLVQTVAGGASASLSYKFRYTLESNVDYAYAQVSSDGGATWANLATYTGTSSAWSTANFTLGSYPGPLAFRFRQATSATQQFDGIQVDDVTISGSANVSLAWSAISGATYDLTVNGVKIRTGLTAPFANLTAADGVQASNTWSVTAHFAGSDLASSPGTFTASSATAPVAPTITAPAQSTTVYCDPTITWTTSTTGIVFDVVDNANNVLAAGLTGTSWTPTGSAKFSAGTKVVKVRARNCLGATALSGVRSFTVNNTPLAPLQGVPADGQVTTSLPTLTWSVTGTQKVDATYSVFLDDNPTPVASGLTALSYTVTQPLSDGSHTWSVTASGCKGSSATSGARTLVVDSTGPAGFSITSPATNTWFGNVATIPITWSASSDTPAGLANYTVVVDGASVATPTSAVTTYDLPASSVIQVTQGFESNTAGWALTGGWGRTSSYTYNGSYSLGQPDYSFSSNYTATTTSAYLGGPGRTVSFARFYDTEGCCDAVYFEASSNGGSTWFSIDGYAGYSGWSVVTYNLASYPVNLLFRFRMSTDSSVGGQGFYFDDFTVTSTQTLTEGLHPVIVRAVDGVGNTTSTPAVNIGIDRTAPIAFTLAIGATSTVTSNGQPTLSWNPSSDATSGLDHYELMVDGVKNGANIPAGTLSAVPASALSEASHAWTVVAVDKAGNTRTATAPSSILVDQTPPNKPTLLIPGNGTWVGDFVPQYKFTTTDTANGSGVSHYKVYVDGVYNDPDTPNASGQYKGVNCAPDTCHDDFNGFGEDALHTWYVVAYDTAGNSRQSDTWTFSTDLNPPGAFDQLSPAIGTTVQTLTPLVCWKTTTDLGSGLKEYTVDVTKGASTTTRHVIPDTLATEQCLRLNSPALTNGSYTWAVTAWDNGGASTLANGAPWTMTVSQDLTAPTTTISTPGADGSLIGCVAYGFIGTTADPGPTPTAPQGSGVDKVEVQIDSTSGAWQQAVLGGDANMKTRPWNWSWSGGTTGQHTLYVRASDKEGNVQATPTARTIQVDCTGPLAFGLNAPAENAYLASCGTFSWSSTTDSPAGMDHYDLVIQPIGGGDPVTYGAGLSTSRSLTGNECLAHGNYTWSVKAVDKLGNATTSNAARTVKVDTLAPVQFPLLSQNPLVGTTGWTCAGGTGASGNLTLTWAPSTDNQSGLSAAPYQLYIDGAAYGPRQVGTTALLYGLADGMHTWKVRAYDLFDNYVDSSVTPPLGSFGIDCTPPGLSAVASLQLNANDVPANPPYHTAHPRSTGVYVSAGEQVHVTAAGQLCFLDDASCDPLYTTGSCAGPQGDNNIVGSKYYPNLPFGQLVAIITGHQATPTVVGSDATFAAPFSGELLLAANDDDSYNCKSRWDEVTVQVGPGFNLQLPSDQVVSDDIQPTFRWSSVSDLGVGVDRLELLVNGVVVEGNLAPTATQFVLPAVAALTEKDNVWRVRAYDKVGNMSATAAWTIHTDLTPPKTFALTLPIEGDIVQSTTPLLQWAKTTDERSEIAQYLIFVDGKYNTAQYPDGSSQTPAQPLSQGNHCFQVKARDVLRHERTADAERCFVVDSMAPDPFEMTSPANGATSYTATPEICWQVGGDNGTGIQQYEIWQSGKHIETVPPPITTPSSGIICWSPQAPLDNGAYEFFVKAVDGAGFATSSPAHTVTIQRDITPPIVTIVEPAPGEISGQAGVLMSGFVVDPSPGTGAAKLDIFDATQPGGYQSVTPDPQSGAWTFNWPVLGDGTLTLCVKAWDHEGNANTASGLTAWPCVTVKTDVSPPEPFDLVSPSSGAWVGARPTFAWQPTTDTPAGVSHYYVQVDALPPRDAGTQAAYQLAESEALADGTHLWTVQAVDAMGNARNAKSQRSIKVDGQNPEQIALDTPTTGSWSNTGKPDFCWFAAADSGGSGLAQYVVRIDGQAHTVSPSTLCYTPPTALSQGSHTWNVAAVDGAGNAGAVSLDRELRVDLTPPGQPSATAPMDGTLLGAGALVFQWLAVADGPVGDASGVCTYIVDLAGKTQEVPGIQTQLKWQGAVAEGTQKWTVRAVDCAGNVGVASVAQTVIHDITAPAAVSILAPVPGTWSASAMPTASWSLATDGNGICSYELTLDSATFALTADDLEWTPANLLSEGLHALAVRAVDCVGNKSPTSTSLFGVDLTPPETPTLVGFPAGSCASTSTPLMHWSACSDDQSGIAATELWIDDALATSLPDGVSQVVAPTALEDGVHTWKVRCIDLAGHTADSEAGTVQVDTTEPVISAMAVAAAPSPQAWVLTIKATDSGLCGIASVSLWVDGQKLATSATAPGLWSAAWSTPADGPHTLKASVKDGAGNSVTYEAATQVGACWAQGECVGVSCATAASTAISCDDGNPCTASDACDGAGQCASGPPTDCNDSDACTGDLCDVLTGCLSISTAADCVDANACTNDGCDAVLGCVFLANTATCEDGAACTVDDACQDSTCMSGAQLVCDDQNTCTADFCDPTTGCLYVPTTDLCTDESACTEGDMCADSVCVPGTVLDCSDGDACTADACDVVGGCSHSAIANCCTEVADCPAQIGCLQSACDVATSTCTVVGLPACCTADSDCDDANPATNDACKLSEGKCVNAAGAETCSVSDGCDDANLCTEDTCAIAQSACLHAKLPGCCLSAADCAEDQTCVLHQCVQSGGGDTGNVDAGSSADVAGADAGSSADIASGVDGSTEDAVTQSDAFDPGDTAAEVDGSGGDEGVTVADAGLDEQTADTPGIDGQGADIQGTDTVGADTQSGGDVSSSDAGSGDGSALGDASGDGIAAADGAETPTAGGSTGSAKTGCNTSPTSSTPGHWAAWWSILAIAGWVVLRRRRA